MREQEGPALGVASVTLYPSACSSHLLRLHLAVRRLEEEGRALPRRRETDVVSFYPAWRSVLSFIQNNHRVPKYRLPMPKI